MPKPGTLPRWATNLTNNDAPSSGQMDTGWTPGQTGVSDYDNYIKYWTYKWIEWLDAGSLGDVTVDELNVTGLILAPDGLNEFDGGILANGNIKTLGVFRFGGTEKLGIPTSLCTSTGHTLGRTQVIFGASADTVYAPLIGLPVNACIIGMKVWFKKGTSNVTEINFDIVRNINNGADDYVGVTVTNAENGIGDTSQEEIGFEHFIASGYDYFLRINRSDTSISPAADRFYHAEVYWTKPAP